MVKASISKSVVAIAVVSAFLAVPSSNWGHGGGDMNAPGGAGARPSMHDQRHSAEFEERLRLLEELADHIAYVPLSESAEVWASGIRDYKVGRSSVEACKKSVEYLVKAAELSASGDPARAASLREMAANIVANSAMPNVSGSNDQTKIWLMVSEGILRKAREAAAIPKSEEPSPASRKKDFKKAGQNKAKSDEDPPPTLIAR